jgi:hypothetical protein
MVDHAPRYPSHDPDIEHYEEKPTSHPIAPYEAGRSVRANYSERPVPLFLSDRDGAPDPSEYMPSLMKGQGSYYASRILAGAVGGVAIALVAALVSSDSAREFMASAKASSVAALSVASVAMRPASAPSKVAAVQPSTAPPSAVAENQAVAAESVTPASAASGTVAVAAVTPTRDDIRADYQGAAQGSVPQAAVVPEQAAPVDVIHHLDAGEIASLLKRADTLIGSGDVAAARLVLRRAAEAGDAHAAMMLGGTYDPTVLEKLHVRGVVPDMAAARSWYEKAKRFGASDAAPQADLLAKRQN